MRARSPTYVEEERLLKESFKTAWKDDNSDEEGDLLRKKDKTKEEKVSIFPFQLFAVALINLG